MQRGKWRRRLRRLAKVIIALLALFAVIAWHDTMRDPEILTTRLELSALPPDQKPLRLLLLSDLHVAGPDMPPSRLAHIIALANAQQPDLVLLAGDFISDRRLATHHYTFREALAPLAAIRAALGAVAVLGNHDHWRDAALGRAELTRIGVTVLGNSAARRGPLAIAGIDDDFTGHADVARTIADARQLGGVPIALSHSPDVFPQMPGDVPLTLAGHTHCGQVRYPWGGTPATMSRYGDRYACGLVREGGRTLIVSAGLGTSVLPFRFFTHPDMWVITLAPRPAAKR
jgi:predicted MPP superfamily phosphohydrolase